MILIYLATEFHCTTWPWNTIPTRIYNKVNVIARNDHGNLRQLTWSW